jgi:hypothetical protein
VVLVRGCGIAVVIGLLLPAPAGAAVADRVERAAARLSVRLAEHPRRLEPSASRLASAVADGRVLVAAQPPARRAAPSRELARVRAGLRRARRASALLRRGHARRSRHEARVARHRLRARLDALRALEVPPSSPPPALVPPPAAAPSPAVPAAPPPPPREFRTSGLLPVSVPVAQQPLRETKPPPLDDPDHPTNPDGTLHYEVDGVEQPHPVFTEAYAISMLEGYRLTGDHEYLRRAVANGRRLLEHAVADGGGLYFAYTFAFDVFGDPADHLAAPWFSGMAQGRGLLMLHRLHDATDDPSWIEAADRVYATTFQPRRTEGPWATFVDDDGYLWFEEYPGASTPLRVLNGHISALFGYWERAQATGDETARKLFDGGATTALHYAEVLRRPGAYSGYSVRVPWQDASYHKLHIRQLHELAILTGDGRFETLAQDYEADRDAAAAGA